MSPAHGVSMSYKLTIIQKPTYMHAIITGVNSRDNVECYLEDIRRECTTRGCSRVLIEERLEGPRLGTLDVFQIAADGSSRALGIFEAIAYVDVNRQGDLMKFAENVASNRGFPFAVFSTVVEAEKWLLDEKRGGAAPQAAADTERPRR